MKKGKPGLPRPTAKRKKPGKPAVDSDTQIPGGPDSFTIDGRVTKAGSPVAGRIVQLFGSDPTHQRLLKEETTDGDGKYLFQYDPAEFKENTQDSTRLFVRVTDNQLPKDSPLFRAAPEEHVDIKIKVKPVLPPTGADMPPANPIFDAAPGGTRDKRLPDSIGTESEKAQIDQFKAQLPQLLQQFKQRGRAQSFLPYLLVRSFTGDRGGRPLHLVDASHSPDIWTIGGNPSTAPDVPDTIDTIAAVGEPNTVYAHVWNLGRAPIIGVKVEFYWFDLSKNVNEANANLIGIARVDLAPRTSTSCHTLVKCPKAWVPAFVNGGHLTLVVRVSCIGDNLTSNPWFPFADRHVAQRDIQVLFVPPPPGP